ncbi:hypothetical protein NVV76_05545 [Pediococcus ethanolidurans]|uniref:hypothetical protein n=1 Tax=Pediococcus ethanolidurans TaxID=319653 RepID=UPI0021E99031|nr:hypothetical protein [Pediococcus ethanolidurans]MCV3327623.1 hypothetical protein [Pediococcus ethanolidurans]
MNNATQAERDAIQRMDDNNTCDYLDTQDKPDAPCDEDSEYDEDEQALERG